MNSIKSERSGTAVWSRVSTQQWLCAIGVGPIAPNQSAQSKPGKSRQYTEKHGQPDRATTLLSAYFWSDRLTNAGPCLGAQTMWPVPQGRSRQTSPALADCNPNNKTNALIKKRLDRPSLRCAVEKTAFGGNCTNPSAARGKPEVAGRSVHTRRFAPIYPGNRWVTLALPLQLHFQMPKQVVSSQ